MITDELRAVVEGHADGAALIDADHHVLHFNESYVRLVGMSRIRTPSIKRLIDLLSEVTVCLFCNAAARV